MDIRTFSFLAIAMIFLLSACRPATPATPTQPLPTATTELPTLTPTSTTTNTPVHSTITPSPSLTASQPPSTATSTPTTMPTATPIAESIFDGVRVTFITNAGFLITVGDTRILIDAIYKGYPGGVLKPILDSQPPFDGVDLILATHEHHDHFDPELVLQYLQSNPETVFVSTPNSVNSILDLDSRMRARLTPIDLKSGEQEQLSISDIDLKAIHLSHGMPGILNLGFIVTIDDVTLFHTGDIDPTVVSVSDLQAYGLPGKQIDISFVPEFLFTEEEFRNHITEGVQARHFIPMHFGMQPPSDLESVFPNIHLFQQPYENWMMP